MCLLHLHYTLSWTVPAVVLILYVRRGLALVLVVDFTYTLVRLKYFQYPINIKLDCYKWCDVESIVLTIHKATYY